MNWNGWGWDVALEDGTTYLSPEAYSATRPQQGSLVGIFDKGGNEVQLSREANGDLSEIKSPSGGWIRLNYDRGRIFEAKDSLGDVVEYDYDSNDRLGAVRYSTGRTTRYMYDSSNRVVEVEDSLAGVLVQNEYDSHGLVVQQMVGGRRTYSFRYAFEKPTRSADVDISDSLGKVTRVEMRATDKGIYYTVEKLARASGRH
jgi:YD repeat-containing protein